MGVWKKTQCNMCGMSCGLEMEIESNQIINVRPDPDSPRSMDYCCRKGRAAKYYVHNEDRLDYPLKKVGDHFERISWEQAYKEIAEKAKKILKEHGPRCFATCGCTLASAQSESVIAKALNTAVGSQYIYNPIGIEFGGNWWSHGRILGDQRFFTEPDEGSTEVLIIWGCNSYVSHQMGQARRLIRNISEDPERMVIVVDPRMSETARMADMHLMVRQGTDSLFLRALIALILKKGWENKKYISQYVADFDKVKPWFEDVDIEASLEVCRIPMETAVRFARILTTKKWGCHQDLGLFMGRHNTLNSYLVVTLSAICGTLLMPGGCIIQDGFTNRGPNTFETESSVWRTVETNRFPVLGSYPAGCLAAELNSEKDNRLRVMFMGMTNPARSFPDSKAVTEGLKKLELLVVIDCVMTETAREADYVLPGKTGYEAYEFNVFQATYPEVTCMLKHPVLEQIGERKEDALIWLEIYKAMGYMPELPQSLYDAAKKAVEKNDRIPFFLKLFMYMLKNKDQFSKIIPIICETMGQAMGSPVRALTWAALLTSPLAGTGMVERAGFGPSKKHKVLQMIPKFKNMCMMDEVFQQVDDKEEGVVCGISDPKECITRHILHEDKKAHLYCDEIDQYIKRITPEKEWKAINKEADYPIILCAGRHSDDGHNATMRNPDTYRYRQPFTVALNPEDADQMNLSEGQKVKVTTKGGYMEVPVEITWQVARGQALIPHHFGFQFNGKTVGTGVNELTRWQDMDELTGNPYFRYVPCRIEALEA